MKFDDYRQDQFLKRKKDTLTNILTMCQNSVILGIDAIDLPDEIPELIERLHDLVTTELGKVD
jgi:hypothetical protein